MCLYVYVSVCVCVCVMCVHARELMKGNSSARARVHSEREVGGRGVGGGGEERQIWDGFG